MIPNGFNNIGSKDSGGWFIVDKVPESLRVEMDDAANMLMYDMYANRPYQEDLPNFVNKQFEFTYSEEFIAYVLRVLKRYEDKIREHHALPIKHYEFDRFTTNPDVNGNTYTGENGGWVTMQDRYEFQHPHTGENTFNFMYWAKVPYSNTDLKLTSPNPKANSGCLGTDYFIVPNNVQKITSTSNRRNPSNVQEIVELQTTSLYEGHLCIIPHYLYRGCTPFYSTEEYKITYRGEIGITKPSTLI